jgi:hypothetical protein
VIPRADIVEWRAFAPWKNDAQVEQDLILSRLIVELFRDPLIRIGLLFRGGTALHKLFLPPAARYSEDLDLVQRTPSPIGPVISAIRSIGDALLGKPKIRQKEDSVMLLFRTNSEMRTGGLRSCPDERESRASPREKMIFPTTERNQEDRGLGST